ncbi:hypothetical protein KM043_018333 [Ampulex compressa]|nr:hypothetical protein KM043_018333 [Ampulex compressa]
MEHGVRSACRVETEVPSSRGRPYILRTRGSPYHGTSAQLGVACPAGSAPCIPLGSPPGPTRPKDSCQSAPPSYAVCTEYASLPGRRDNRPATSQRCRTNLPCANLGERWRLI